MARSPGVELRAAAGESVKDVQVVMRREPTLWRRLARARLYYLMLVPCFALLLTFSYYPAVSAVYDSFFVFDYGLPSHFIGLTNFTDLFGDPVFLGAIWHVFELTVFGVITGVTVPLAVAEWIFRLRSQRSQYIYRILMIWPAVVPEVVGLLIWQFIYDPDSGALNSFLQAIGHPEWTQAWLANPDLALYALMFSAFPFVGGAAVLIYLAGLQGISKEVFDAASIDGASARRRFWSIDLPLIRGQIKLNMVLAILTGMQAFIGSLLLTNGGPLNATNVPILYMYQEAFTYGKFGYASAIGVLVFLAVFLLTFINLKVMRERS
jgi:ABC-type sugar transport system permease subunit